MWYNWNTVKEGVGKTLNLVGTVLLASGISTLPIDVSFRLILLGVFCLALWYVYNPNG
jgi:hypothetical protein